MPELMTLDVIDRPHGGALRAMRAMTAVRPGAAPGLRACIALGTGRFATRPLPHPTPRRIGVLSVWEGDPAGEPEGWAHLLARLAVGAREHWHVRGEVARASYSEPWRGWTPETDGVRPLADDEPALILISGNLRARFVPAFLRASAGAVAHAFDHPGYLGGLGVQSAPLNTTSCSAWRTYADARDYAYRAGSHATAMKEDRANSHHRTEWFTRVRPLAERGTLAGTAPFAGLLERIAA